MTMKKRQDAAGVLTAGKKSNTKNTKAKAKPNAGLLAGYRRLEEACVSTCKELQKKITDLDKRGDIRPWEDEEYCILSETAKRLQWGKKLCDIVFELVYDSVREFCE